jgi:hypothetical protein
MFVWRLWNEGEIGSVGAIGSIMIAGLSLIVFALRVVVRARHGSKTDNAMKMASPCLRALDRAPLRGSAAHHGRGCRIIWSRLRRSAKTAMGSLASVADETHRYDYVSVARLPALAKRLSACDHLRIRQIQI